MACERIWRLEIDADNNLMYWQGCEGMLGVGEPFVYLVSVLLTEQILTPTLTDPV